MDSSKEKANRNKFKNTIAKTIFRFLGRGFQCAALYDDNIRNEIKNIEELTVVMLKVEPLGPQMLMQKRGSKMLYIGSKETKRVDIAICFKNIDAALMVLTGQIGIDRAYAEHRFTLKGDIFSTMPLVRALYIVEAYLFPSFIAKKILKSIPKRTTNRLKIYSGLLFGIK